MAQLLGLCLFTAEGLSSTPGQGTTILQAARCGQGKNRRNAGETDVFREIYKQVLFGENEKHVFTIGCVYGGKEKEVIEHAIELKG